MAGPGHPYHTAAAVAAWSFLHGYVTLGALRCVRGLRAHKGGLERGMEAFLSNFRSRAEPVGKGHSMRATGVRRRKKPRADDKSRDVFGQSASVEGFAANGHMDEFGCSVDQ